MTRMLFVPNPHVRLDRPYAAPYVPLELLFGYVTDIRSLSKGRASASITPSHFEQVPNSLLTKIVESSTKAPART